MRTPDRCPSCKQHVLPPRQPHPGKLILSRLDELARPQAWLARQAETNVKCVNEIVKGKAGIGPKLAIAFGRVLGLDPRLLIRMQAEYDLARWRWLHPLEGGVLRQRRGRD